MQVMRVYENSTCMQRAAQACRYGGPMNPSSPSEPEGVPPPPLVCCRCLARLGIMMLTCVGNRFARDLAWFSVIYRENPIWMSVLTTGIGFIYDPMTALRTDIHIWFWEPAWFSVNWRDLAWIDVIQPAHSGIISHFLQFSGILPLGGAKLCHG